MNNKLLRQITGQPWCISNTDELIANVLNKVAMPLDDDEDDDKEPKVKEPMLSQIGNVALINISGTITNADIDDAVSVRDIKNSLLEAIYNTTADTIIMLFDSGGGSIAGIPELADFIYNIRTLSGKTIIAYTDTVMGSGALWLGVQCDGVYCSNTALIGSMGVISITFDFEDAYLKQGVKPHVFSTGDCKGAGGKVGGHSEKQVRSLEAQVERYGQIFAGAVQKARALTNTQIDALKDAHTSIGTDAIKDGLVDDVVSFEQLLKAYLKF
jgi:ClpP class serine protease